MRVLHITAGNLYGGVETLLATLARFRHLCPEMTPAFAVCFDGRLSRELTATEAPVYNMGEVRASRFWSVLRARRQMRRLLAEKRFDVAVSHMEWAHAIFGPEVIRASIPLVNWIHGVAASRSWLDRWASLTPPHLAIANSEYTRHATRAIFPRSPVRTLTYPVALSPPAAPDRDSMRRSLGVSGNTAVILQVSRMEAWKGHHLHLEALARLKEVPGWVCWFAGGAQRQEECEYLKQLEARAQALGIGDRVRFLGQRSDIRVLMDAADIFCQPNMAPEPFGIVFIEALQAGLPVVSTRMGGASEIVDETCGMLTAPNDPDGLAGSLRLLVESAAERKRLARRGPDRAKALCDPARQIGRLKDLLNLSISRECIETFPSLQMR